MSKSHNAAQIKVFREVDGKMVEVPVSNVNTPEDYAKQPTFDVANLPLPLFYPGMKDFVFDLRKIREAGKKATQIMNEWVERAIRRQYEKREKTMSEQDRAKTALAWLDDFIKNAGTLHPTQNERLLAVRTFLQEKVSKEPEPEKKEYVIYWREAKCWLSGFGSTAQPTWTRAWNDTQAYNKEGGEEALKKAKEYTTGDMTLLMNTLDDPHGPEAKRYAIKSNADYWTGNPLDYWRPDASLAVVYGSEEEAQAFIDSKPGWNRLPSLKIVTLEEPQKAVKAGDRVGDGFSVGIVLESVKDQPSLVGTLIGDAPRKEMDPRDLPLEVASVCGLKEIPKDEKRYSIRLNEKAFISTVPPHEYDWTWMNLHMGEVTKFTLDEAKTVLKRYLTEPNELRDKWAKPDGFLGVVEITKNPAGGHTVTPAREKVYVCRAQKLIGHNYWTGSLWSDNFEDAKKFPNRDAAYAEIVSYGWCKVTIYEGEQLVKVEVPAAKTEAPFYAIQLEGERKFWAASPLAGWTADLKDACRYNDYADADSAVANIFKTSGKKARVVRCAWDAAEGTAKPMTPKKYRVKLAHDQYVFNHSRDGRDWLWTRGDGFGKPDQTPTLYSREEAESIVTDIKENRRYGFIAKLDPCVEEVDG
jgi:hypothetical protein